MAATISISLIGCFFVILLVLLKPSIAIKNHNIPIYWIPVFLAAIILIVFKCVDIKIVLNSLFQNTPVNPLKILVLFISMVLLSVYLDEVGFFKYLASSALAKSGSSQIRAFTILYFTVGLLTIVTSNDIIILTFSPFICYFAKNAKINPLPYLIGEFVSANTWSMALIIGNPTNIFLATGAGINFAQYIKVMFLPTCIAGITAYLVLLLVFYKELTKENIVINAQLIEIKDKKGFLIGIAHLALCITLLVVASYVNFELWIISLFFLISLLISITIYKIITKNSFDDIKSTIKRAPFELIPFVISMFIIVISFEENGLIEKISEVFKKENTILCGVSSYLSSNIINNIPSSVLFESIFKENGLILENVYAAIIGTNIGAYFTPIGALAGIMWSGILTEQNIKFSFGKFIMYGAIISLPTLLSAIGGLELMDIALHGAI